MAAGADAANAGSARREAREFRISAGAPVESFGTPRRLTARVGKIAERQEDLEEVDHRSARLGGIQGRSADPRCARLREEAGGRVRPDHSPADAEGGIPRLQQTAARQERGRHASRGPDGLLRELQFPKQMNWDARLEDGKENFVFGRPIRWLLLHLRRTRRALHDRPLRRGAIRRWCRKSNRGR